MLGGSLTRPCTTCPRSLGGNSILVGSCRGLCSGVLKGHSAEAILLGCRLLLQLWCHERFMIGRPVVSLEGPIRRPERGGVNGSPKFTTKDSHMRLPRSRSHNGPTNSRNKPKTILKRKHNSRSKGLSCHAKAQADGPRGWGGRSASTGRMVRDPRADSPKKRNRTSNTAPRKTDGPRLVPGWSASNRFHADSTRSPGGQYAVSRRTVRPARGRSDTPTRMVRQTTCSKTLTPQRIYARTRKNWTNMRRTQTARTVRGLQATVRQARTE
jgi:hypothetical protein